MWWIAAIVKTQSMMVMMVMRTTMKGMRKKGNVKMAVKATTTITTVEITKILAVRPITTRLLTAPPAPATTTTAVAVVVVVVVVC